MKIAYVVRDLKGNGGIQSFAKNTAKGLSGALEVQLLDWHTPHSYVQEGIVRFAPTQISVRLYRQWFVQAQNEILQDSKPDLIHFWHIKSPMATIDSIDIPYVLTCHGSEILEESVGAYQREKFLKSLGNAAAITTPSNFTKDYLISHYDLPKDKIYVISPGISPKFPKQKNSKDDSIEEIPVVGTLTRFVKRKNVINIIAALNILQSRGVHFKYVLAGNGAFMMRKKIERALKKSSIDWQYFGSISENEKWNSFYPSLDVFVLPPLFRKGDVEGFGIVFLEANSCGVPVVASDTGGVTDAVREHVSGLLADPTSPEDIADKIQELLNPKERASYTPNKWAESFEQSIQSKKFEDLYQKVAGS